MTTTEVVNGISYEVGWEIEEVLESHGAGYNSLALNGYIDSDEHGDPSFQASGEGFPGEINEIYDIEKIKR